MKKLNRRKFFNNVSIGALSAFVFSIFPFKVFGKSNTKRVKVKIHPNSVKRNK